MTQVEMLTIQMEIYLPAKFEGGDLYVEDPTSTGSQSHEMEIIEHMEHSLFSLNKIMEGNEQTPPDQGHPNLNASKPTQRTSRATCSEQPHSGTEHSPR